MGDTDAIPAASAVATENVAPYWSTSGALPIVGRAPLNRYGGEKISARV